MTETRAMYEYPFECDESRTGETWQAAEWTHVRDRRSIREYRVEALVECPHCGEMHSTETVAPLPLGDG